MDFRARSLKLQDWVRADVPETAKETVEKWRLRGIHLAKVDDQSYGLYFVSYDGGSPPKAAEGFEMEIRRPVR